MIGMIGKDKEGLEGWEGKEPCHNHFPMFFSSKVLSPRCSIKKPVESKYFKQNRLSNFPGPKIWLNLSGKSV